MAVYLYLNMLPESLVASMLPPHEFGTYMAVGTEKKSRGQAKFFSVDRNFASNYFPMAEIESRCVPHANGQPKHSVYLSIYRVLEHVPMSAIGDLFVVTRDGRVLEIQKTKDIPPCSHEFHLYQEICPVRPRVASSLHPPEFAAFLADPKKSIHVPKIFFADMRLGGLASDPEKGSSRDLPYPSLEHLRDCLVQLRSAPTKGTKTVDRTPSMEIPYRALQHGFFLGDGKELLFYPMPGEQELQTKYFEWWRSASM